MIEENIRKKEHEENIAKFGKHKIRDLTLPIIPVHDFSKEQDDDEENIAKFTRSFYCSPKSERKKMKQR